MPWSPLFTLDLNSAQQTDQRVFLTRLHGLLEEGPETTEDWELDPDPPWYPQFRCPKYLWQILRGGLLQRTFPLSGVGLSFVVEPAALWRSGAVLLSFGGSILKPKPADNSQTGPTVGRGYLYHVVGQPPRDASSLERGVRFASGSLWDTWNLMAPMGFERCALIRASTFPCWYWVS